MNEHSATSFKDLLEVAVTNEQILDTIAHLRQLRPMMPNRIRRLNECIDLLWLRLSYEMMGEANWLVSPFAPWVPGEKGNVDDE